MKKVILTISILIFIIVIFSYAIFSSGFLFEDFAEDVATILEENQKQQIELKNSFQVIAEGLKIPWEIAFLPDGRLLATERAGDLAIIVNGNIKRIPVEGVSSVGEGGLLGMALHPNFQENNFLYLYLTYKENDLMKNKVERYVFSQDSLKNKKIILDDIPGSQNHNGGRISFGPDGYLYITTGDAQNSQLAQDKNSLAGKILRVADDGKIPKDNPFDNSIFSLGHRNVQGIGWDTSGNLWATEHGRSGVLSGFDELNLIKKGNNYGWPLIQGDEIKEGMRLPVIHSGPTKTWAPAGLIFLNGKLYFGGLKGQALYEVLVDVENVKDFRENFLGQFGRIRAVVKDSQNNIYIATSNTDGRGEPLKGDDKIIKIISDFSMQTTPQ